MADADLTAAVEFLIGSGEAERFGRVLAEGFASAPPSRDQIAVMAMQGIATFWELGGEDPAARIRGLARNAYAVADAMLAERAKGGGHA